nr:cyclase family protein [uncultured Actinoplanes sp.]
MLQHRAEFDAVVTFATGGDLRARGYQLAVPHAEVTHAEVTRLFAEALGGPAVETVEITGLRIFAEPEPDPGLVLPSSRARVRLVELSHVISGGMRTFPGAPEPIVEVHETWAASRTRYAEGTEFSMDRITMVGQTGTYLDSPRHRYEGGTDLAGMPLERLADLPTVLVRVAGSGRHVIDAGDLEPLTVAGHAVLLHTGADGRFGTAQYASGSPFLTREGAALLVERGAALVGIDAMNIDDMSDGERPAHTVLLAAGIPIVENLTNLAELPPTGARFTATPPRITAFGTFPVRAYAAVPYYEDHDHTRSAGWQPT